MNGTTPQLVKIEGMPGPSDLEAWLLAHPAALAASAASCLWISFILIYKIWSIHRSDHAAKKVLWSLILLIPFVGWLFYGGFYNPPRPHSGASPEGTD